MTREELSFGSGVAEGGKKNMPVRPDVNDREKYNALVEAVRKQDLELEKGNYVAGESKIEGMGWFARRNFKQGEIVSRYFVGRYEDLRTADQIEEGSDFDRSAVQFGITPEGEAIYIGVPNHPRKYINHSCEPNAGIRRFVVPEGELKSEVVAIRDINEGEEITIDYSTTQLEEWHMECKCGKKSCRHDITDFVSLAPDLRDKYIKLGIVPDWMAQAVEEKTGKKS